MKFPPNVSSGPAAVLPSLTMRRLGRVVIEYVRSGRPAIFDLVENRHDHVLTLVTCDLIRAVAADRELAELLERASTTDQDEQCRAQFAEAASAIRTGSTE